MTTQRAPDTSAEGRAWRYSINHGPDGEENYANVYTDNGELVGNLRIGVAMKIVDGMNALADAAGQAAPVPPPVEGLRPKVPHQLIGAVTKPGTDYPAYINIARITDGAVRVIVRSARSANGAEGPTSEIEIPPGEWSGLASAILQDSAPTTRSVAGELETTAEERAERIEFLEQRGRGSSDEGCLLRDFAKVLDRAEGLAKEVERLNKHIALHRGDTLSLSNDVDIFRERAEEAEAKLAVYEAPIGDGEAGRLAQKAEWWSENLATAVGPGSEHIRDDSLRLIKLDLLLIAALVRRLSAAHAECKGENTKLREVLRNVSAAGHRTETRRVGDAYNADDYEEIETISTEAKIADAALAPASGEKAT